MSIIPSSEVKLSLIEVGVLELDKIYRMSVDIMNKIRYNFYDMWS